MIIAGTGHRPNKLLPEVCGKFVHRDLIELLTPVLPGLATHIISGMALGWDVALAETARRLGIPWTAAIPFRGQEERWPERLQRAYRDTLASASYVVEVCDPGYEPWKFQARNEWMVNHCDLVLACWDGSDGGTANCVRYAEGKKPIVNAWEEFYEFMIPF